MDKHMSMMKKMMGSEQSMMIKDAITLFREAARLDPRSPLPPAALVEAIRYDITGDRRSLDEERDGRVSRLYTFIDQQLLLS